MEKPVVFFDIDGTLYNKNKQLPASAKSAVLKLKEKGIHVAIATGRGPFMIEQLRSELGIDWFVSYNGQYVEANGEIIFHRPIPVSELTRLEQEADAQQHPMVFMSRERMITNRYKHAVVEHCIRSLDIDSPTYVPKGYLEGNTYQALIFCTKEEEHIYREKYPHLEYVRWHEHTTDVLNGGISKAVGIRKLIDHLGLSMDHVYAFGDGLNDIEMLQAVRTGIAMGNAPEEVKQVADWVTRSSDEDGIEYGLKYLGLIE